MAIEGSQRASAARRKLPWQPYIDATLGFRNHWYAAFFGHELKEGDLCQGLGEKAVEARAETMLGERILFRRCNGVVRAVADQCMHKGVPFSVRPECYTKDTITCWYHGFTYDLRDGTLRTIVTDPNSPLIGKLRLKTYPVEERQGLVFVFIGDLDPPPPLADDLQPGFLDPRLDVYPLGWSKLVRCNWRLAAENGFDPAHAYIHRNSPVIRAFQMPTVLGDTGISPGHGMEIIEGPGPKGVMLVRGAGTPIWEAEIEPGVTLKARYMPGDEGVTDEMVPEVSIWMPGCLKVDPFPTPTSIHFEWYVPVDADHHRYLMTWGRPVETPAQAARFHEEMTTFWKDFITTRFNHDDVTAREAMHDFYAGEDGWNRERLFGPDVVITKWRELASRVNRGIQRRS